MLIPRKGNLKAGIINALLLEFYAAVIILVVVVLISGCAQTQGGFPSVIVHKYDYQAKPPALAPGTPPSPPTEPPLVGYRTIYSESSSSDWGDPTLVIFKNEGYRVVRLSIDGQTEIRLAGYQATADIHLLLGEHRVRMVIEKPTAVHGTLEVLRFLSISVRPEGQAQIFHLYDY